MGKANADRNPAPVQLKTPSYVRYVGLSDARGITRQDFASIGLDHDSLWWNAQNNWRVPLSNISDAAYVAAIEPDRELILVEGEEVQGSEEG